MRTSTVKTALPKAIAVGTLVVVTLAATPAPAQVCGPNPDGRVANAVYRDTTIVWEPVVEYEQMVLTIGGPCEDIVRVFRRGEPISFDIREIERVQDGAYTWELRRAPVLDATTQEALAKARALGDDSIWWDLWQRGAIPQGPYVDSASFRVAKGVIVPPGLGTEKNGLTAMNDKSAARPVSSTSLAQASSAAVARGSGLTPITAADQVIPDDLIVQGSLCVGFDCVNNESFSFDTIRMKENNLRIKFDDTSTTAGYPKNDWQLTANESDSGSASKFSIEDITGAKVPFTVRAGAASNSIFVDSTGRVGFRTSTPVLDLHVNTSNTPALRLEQNNSGGFTAQTWDIGANEANFFVRDVTGGSKLSFRVRPGAPTSSIDISADGDVGVGTASPTGALHVSRSTGAAAAVLKLTNNSGIQILYDRTDGVANDWQQSNFNGTFEISVPGSTPAQFSLNANGNLTIGGTQYLTGSSRDLKENFVPVDSRMILQRLIDMPLTEWNAKTDPQQRHIGPVAEDWWTSFRLGPDDKHVSPTDIGGVALAAIKGLHQVIAEKDAAIAQLEQTVDELATRLAAIENMLKRQDE
ncbi:MAG TPA: tail fiber domain-containing protein [Thermoanaerobaculia bacterium]|nr:tail fiber domain-containing protein [Thermoanaerobaculia bacterium]